MIVLAGDSFTGWDQNVEKTWHVRIKNEYPNVVNIGKGGISNVDILKKLSNLATHANHYAVHRHMLTCSPLITAKNSQYLSSECLSYSF